MTNVEVVAPGALTTIQDLGRPGWAHIGVPRSGAADRPALRLANRLVGNDEGATALETTLSGPRLRFDAPTVIALSGAPVDSIPMHTAIDLAAGEVLKVGNARQGLRTYIAVRGGLDVPRVLGSAATDLLTGLGPAPLSRGDVLELGAARGGRTPSTPAPAPPPILQLPQISQLRFIAGPRSDWFSDESICRLGAEEFAVNHASNRIGVRLDGPRMQRVRSGELPSEGLIAGAIQVPPDGQPIVLLADHPTTGGYPVIGVVIEDDLPLVAQLRPGGRARFTRADG
jgi:biotin-dependent carboxylase-like uncharacterized protein